MLGREGGGDEPVVVGVVDADAVSLADPEGAVELEHEVDGAGGAGGRGSAGGEREVARRRRRRLRAAYTEGLDRASALEDSVNDLEICLAFELLISTALLRTTPAGRSTITVVDVVKRVLVLFIVGGGGRGISSGVLGALSVASRAAAGDAIVVAFEEEVLVERGRHVRALRVVQCPQRQRRGGRLNHDILSDLRQASDRMAEGADRMLIQQHIQHDESGR